MDNPITNLRLASARNIIEILLVLCHVRTPANRQIGLVVWTGDTNLLASLSRVCRMYTCAMLVRCGQCFRMAQYGGWLSMRVHWLFHYDAQIHHASICRACTQANRHDAYDASLQNIQLMSSFRRRDYLQEGRCHACNLRVSSVVLHQRHLCRVLAQEVVGPATFDSDGTGDSD